MKYLYLFLLTAIVNISIITPVSAQILNADKFGKSTDTAKTMTGISGITELNFKITERLSFSIYLNGYYDSAPPVPIEKLYYSIQNKFRIEF